MWLIVIKIWATTIKMCMCLRLIIIKVLKRFLFFLYLTFCLSVGSASAANSKHKHSLHDFPSETGGGDGSTCLASKLSFSLSLPSTAVVAVEAKF